MNDKPDVTSIVNGSLADANNTLEIAKIYVIDSAEMAECVAEELQVTKGKLKTLEETRMGITRPMDEAKQKVMDLFSKPKNILLEAEAFLKNSLLAWNQKERLRLENERKAAEEEQRKITKAAEAEAAQAKIVADELAAANAPAQLVLEASQDAELAAQTAESLQYLAPVAAAKAKQEGISVRDNWKAEVTDMMALVKAVAAGEASIELLEPATTAINQHAKALKTEFKVPGIRVFNDQGISARAKR